LASLADGSSQRTLRDVILSGKDGRQWSADVYLQSLEEPCDVPPIAAAVLVIVEDVSFRASMAQHIPDGEMAAKVAHELNNPLDGVLRYIGLAERAPGRQRARYLKGAKDGLQQIAGILRDLSDHGRMGGSDRRTAPLAELIEQAASAAAPRAQALGVRVVCDVTTNEPTEAPESLFQVFSNLVRNALDAMPNGGVLTIRARSELGGHVVEFVDTGCGMSEEQAEHIFEPFYTTKAPGEGHGLGLAICRDIVSRAGGTISIRAPLRRGVIVTIRLPLESGASQDGAAEHLTATDATEALFRGSADG